MSFACYINGIKEIYYILKIKNFLTSESEQIRHKFMNFVRFTQVQFIFNSFFFFYLLGGILISEI